MKKGERCEGKKKEKRKKNCDKAVELERRGGGRLIKLYEVLISESNVGCIEFYFILF